MGFTGAADRADVSGGFGQGETRPQGVTGIGTTGYVIGRTNDRIIEIADMSDPDTSVFVSASLGNSNSMAAHNGSLFVFIGTTLKRFDPPFSATDEGTDVLIITGDTPRALTSDGTNLWYINQIGTGNVLVRIDDIDGTPDTTAIGSISGTSNFRGLVWHDGFFWGVDPSTDALYVIDESDYSRTQVGSFSQFVGPIATPQGLGVVDGEGYIVANDNSGSLWELRDFKFTSEIADQSWTVGTAVSVSAPDTEDGATPLTYAISPTLPAGVTLDTSTGGISGTPTATADATDYTLTATDDNGIEATTIFSASVAASSAVTLVATTLEIVSGNNQSATEEEALTNPLIVQVNDQNGDPFQGATVTFSVSPNDATLGTTTATTNSDGRAQTTLTLGGTVGDYTVTTSVANLTDVEFTATATATVVTPVLGWEVPSEAVGNTFEATLTSNVELDDAPTVDDLRLRDDDNSDPIVFLNSSNTTITAIAGTNNYLIEIVLTGTYDDNYTIRINGNTVEYNSVYIISTQLASSVFSIDSSIGAANNAPSFQDSSYSFSDVAIAVATVVGTVAATDADNDPITYTLTGADAANFDIDSDGEITVETALTNSATYNFNVVANDAIATTSVAVTVIAIAAAQTSEIDTVSLANQTLILFEKERNHTTTPSEANDNDRSTSTTETTVECEIDDVDGNDTEFDYIFIRCSGVASYNLSVDGIDQGTRTLLTEIQVTDAEPVIDNVSITRNGWQHDLLAFETVLSGSSAILTFTGTDIKVNEVLILKKSIIENQNYTSLTHSKVDINSELNSIQSGEISRAFSTRGDRLRWRSNFVLEFISDNEDFEAFLSWIAENLDIVVAHDPQLYPWRVYKAKFLESRYNVPYMSKVIEAGSLVPFQVQENRPIGTQLAVNRKESFNIEDSKNRYLFFNHCQHLLPGRVTTSSGSIERKASDNKFKTFSTQTTLIFDISKNDESTEVTHIWLKATGVTFYEVQTQVSNTWTTQETVTPTQTNYSSWNNSLEKLASAITDTSVRLVFSGSSIKISEIMLLHHAGGLNLMQEINPVKVDRNSIQSNSESGEIRSRSLGSDRLKWELEFNTVFTELHASEDFIDWADANPNFTFAERPESKSWCVYPSTFLNDAFNITLLSDTIQIGEVVDFQIGER